MRKRTIYLDNNATTRPLRSVVKTVKRVLAKNYGNPSSLYTSAYETKEILEEARMTVASAIGARPEEIIFTGSASEGNNQALTTLFETYFPGKKKFISTPIEHPSVLETLKYLEGRGATIEFIPVDAHGIIDIAALEQMVDDDTIAVCVMFANNETGSVQDIRRCARIAHDRNALFLSDCVQALGKTGLDMKELGIDYAAFSAHKIHGPKGVGALYAGSGVPVLSFVHGGHQESGKRAGTENIHSIAGFAKACENIPRLLAHRERIGHLRNSLARKLKSLDMGITVNTPLDKSVPNTLNVTFDGIPNTMILALFDYYGICISAGSACSTPENKPSHVLTAIGLSDAKARESVRISLSSFTRARDIHRVISLLEKMRDGKTPHLDMMPPSSLNEAELFNPANFILDVRYWYDKLKLKSLPGAHEASLFRFWKYLKHIPRDRKIIVVCQGGLYSPLIVFYLKKKGYRDVCFVTGGMEGWKAAYPELYAAHAGKNVIRMKR